MTDEELAKLCEEHADLNLEVTAEGDMLDPVEVRGEGPVEGFVLELAPVWDSFGD